MIFDFHFLNIAGEAESQGDGEIFWDILAFLDRFGLGATSLDLPSHSGGSGGGALSNFYFLLFPGFNHCLLITSSPQIEPGRG